MLYLQQVYYIAKRRHLIGPSLDEKTRVQQKNIVLSLIIITIAAIAISYGYHILRR